MNRISAAENLVIEITPGYWRLVTFTEGGQLTEVLHAARNLPLTFSPDFALSRRLPTIGKLPAKYVRQVVLGWSHEDDAWHLGLLLVRDLADIRGSRWCEIANWPDPDPAVFIDLAREAGESLASLLDVPFKVIEPRPEAEIPRREVKLHAESIDLGTWRMAPPDNSRLVFDRGRRWRTTRLLRIFWYGILTVVYIVLSVTTLQNNLALPNSGIMLPTPELLPYLGIAAAIVSGGITFYAFYELLTRYNRIVVDGAAREIRIQRGDRVKQTRPAGEFSAVYVTHVLRRRRNRLHIEHGEINLFRASGTFERLLEQDERDDEYLPDIQMEEHGLVEAVMPLEPAEQLTDLQSCALHLAHTLGDLPCYYDQREK
ncbi:MAG: hypothetical protein ACOCYT_01180 [Chloroflexota bacterium]